ncbi:hypothetical protein HGG65_10345 [Alteromonadaceae bacterium A_SAG4]|nr:hypothetical protein [Alteromonadaceae bacterium A_SAG4]NKX17938.1 hypothetical protein [Alteromonadaceae bacterium A_SAG5]NKX34613.1 hypothetical protein [Alteromonadaceae bacterium A_SAG3]
MTTEISACWICGNTADSGEHKFKRKDLRRAYGSGAYKGESLVLHITNNSEKKVYGSNAKSLKYSKSLCCTCNNDTSKPWDLAYDQLLDFMFTNENRIISNRKLDFCDVYGNEFPLKINELKKYFAKALGCRFTEAWGHAPSELVSFLKNSNDHDALRITFSVNADKLCLREDYRNGLIGYSDLLSYYKSDGISLGYRTKHFVSWFETFLWFKLPIEPNYGAELIETTPIMKLDFLSYLPDEKRKNIISSKNAT